jgi:hypothetical protein
VKGALRTEENAVTRIWRRKDGLARELRALRPEFSDDFVRGLSEHIDPSGRRTRLHAGARLSFVAGLTVLVLGMVVSFGGLGYAASETSQVLKVAKRAVTPSRPHVVHNTAAQAQYGPEKVTICHKGHTITISRSALPAHLRHGDAVGPCPTGGVAGASGTRSLTASPGTTATGQTLPFTGISLGVTVLVSLGLMILGLALRRRADRKS